MGYVLTGRAMDIFTSEQGLCYILGYLARPGRIKYIEAQVPYGKEQKFMNAYPGADYDNMKTSLDKGTQRKTTENELPSLTQCTA